MQHLIFSLGWSTPPFGTESSMLPSRSCVIDESAPIHLRRRRRCRRSLIVRMMMMKRTWRWSTSSSSRGTPHQQQQQQQRRRQANNNNRRRGAAAVSITTTLCCRFVPYMALPFFNFFIFCSPPGSSSSVHLLTISILR